MSFCDWIRLEDDVGEYLARPDRRQLIDIAHDQKRGPLGHGLHERLHQHDIDHGGFVDHQQVAIERVIFATLESATPGSTSSSRWMVLASKPVASVIPAGRRAQQKVDALCREDTQNGSDDCGFADARAPVMTSALDVNASRSEGQPSNGRTRP